MDLLDEVAIPIPCPRCGKEAMKKIGWLKANVDIICEACNTVLRHDREQLCREAQAIHEKLFKERQRGKREV